METQTSTVKGGNKKLSIFAVIYIAYVAIGICFAMIGLTINNELQKQDIHIEHLIRDISSISSSPKIQCQSDDVCPHGFCKLNLINASLSSCVCDKGFIDLNGGNCNYEQKSGLVALLVSIFVGALGVDWFYLYLGNAGYGAAGFFKLITIGGCGIWWIVDIIRIAVGAFPDGQGQPLSAIS